jgi:hypothetical protein
MRLLRKFVHLHDSQVRVNEAKARTRAPAKPGKAR